jgi:hypothetical protein
MDIINFDLFSNALKMSTLFTFPANQGSKWNIPIAINDGLD